MYRFLGETVGKIGGHPICNICPKVSKDPVQFTRARLYNYFSLIIRLANPRFGNLRQKILTTPDQMVYNLQLQFIYATDFEAVIVNHSLMLFDSPICCFKAVMASRRSSFFRFLSVI